MNFMLPILLEQMGKYQLAIFQCIRDRKFEDAVKILQEYDKWSKSLNDTSSQGDLKE